jgi:hypothetical protein
MLAHFRISLFLLISFAAAPLFLFIDIQNRILECGQSRLQLEAKQTSLQTHTSVYTGNLARTSIKTGFSG